jgi:hypothetical protein
MKAISFLSALFLMSVLHAQPNPVKWTFFSKKIGDKQYEVEMRAVINPGWHLYAQQQPADAIAIPTEFVLNPNPLFNLKGKIREEGKLERYKDATLGVSANQYTGQVSFFQVVALKVKAKTALTGTVEYQTCDDEKCLPPKKVSFTIPLK